MTHFLAKKNSKLLVLYLLFRSTPGVLSIYNFFIDTREIRVSTNGRGKICWILRLYEVVKGTSEIYLHIIALFAFYFAHNRTKQPKQSKTTVNTASRQEQMAGKRTWQHGTRRTIPLPLLFTSAAIDKLLPWCSQTFAVMFSNFCRDVRKLLP